jgi:hypothetical protein
VSTKIEHVSLVKENRDFEPGSFFGENERISTFQKRDGILCRFDAGLVVQLKICILQFSYRPCGAVENMHSAI